MKKRILIGIVLIIIVGLSMELKVAINKADAQNRLDPPPEVIVRSPNNVVWKITVDNAGILGTDSIGVYIP